MSFTLDKILTERISQERRWGEQDHSNEFWLVILLEEVGEVAKEILTDKYARIDTQELRHEVIQVAAVALAWAECHDNRANSNEGVLDNDK